MGTINTRVRLKNDTTAEWKKAGDKGFVPQKGEFIYYNDTNTAKVGDGTTNINQVPFLADPHRHYLSRDPMQNDDKAYTYYKLASFPVDNAGSSCSLTINGRIGGWNNYNRGYVSLIISNRDGVTATGAIYGDIDYHFCDLVVYTSGASSLNSTAIIYVKTWPCFAFDLTIGGMSGTEDIYDGIGSTTTPAGTLAWSLSQNASKFIQVTDSGDILKGGSSVIAQNQVSNANPTLAWGETKTVGTIGNTNFTVKMPANPNTHQSIKTLNTNITTSQALQDNEAITGTGQINLHKIAKTGNYSDLNGKLNTGYKTSGKNYKVSADNNNDLYVNVPWDNTTYTAADGIKLEGTTFKHTNTVTKQDAIGLYKFKYDAQGHITGASAVAKSDITNLGIPGANTDTNQTVKGNDISFDSNAAINIVGGGHTTVSGDAKTNQITVSSTWPSFTDLGIQNGYYLNSHSFIRWENPGHPFDGSFTDYPYNYGGLGWRGQSDAVSIFASETWHDNLDLIIKFDDDNSNKLQIQNAQGQTTVKIGATGYISAGEIYRLGQPVASTGTTTSTNTTGITVSATSSTPSFTGTSHSHTASDSGHTHTYAKATSASFTGAAHNHTASDSGHAHTYSKTTSASFIGTAHNHTITDKGHGHIYAKATSASFTGSTHGHTASDSGHTHTVNYGTKGVSIDKAADDATTYYYIKTYGSASFAGSSHSHSITDKSHHHSYTKTTGASFTGTADSTASSKTGISASASAPTFTGTAHNHGVGDNGHSHTALINNGNVQINTTASGVTNYYYLQSGGGSSTFTGTAHNHDITDNGHTHTYSKATSVSTNATGNHSHTYRKTEPSYDSTTETLILTVSSPSTGAAGNHSHTTSIGYTDTTTTNSKTSISINNATAGGTVSTTVYDPHFGLRNGDKRTSISNTFLFALSNTAVTVNTAKTGISINNTTAGGSVGAPTITITDPGHTHSYTPAGSVGLSSAIVSTTDSATGITVTNGATAGGTVTLNGLGSNWGRRVGDQYTEFDAALLNCAIGQATTSSGKANISVSNTTAGGSISLGYTDTATDGSYTGISINNATAGGSVTLGYKDTATNSSAANITVDNATAGGSVSLGYTDTATGSGKASISVGGTTAGGSVSTPSITVKVNDPGHKHTSREEE